MIKQFFIMARIEDRTRERLDSNNPYNRNKNICVLEVAKHLKVNSNQVKYLHYVSDLVKAAKVKFSIRDITYRIKRYSTVGSIRKTLKRLSEKSKDVCNIIGFIIRLDEHVIYMAANGRTVIDTDPKKRDVRIVYNIYAVIKTY